MFRHQKRLVNYEAVQLKASSCGLCSGTHHALLRNNIDVVPLVEESKRAEQVGNITFSVAAIVILWQLGYHEQLRIK